MRHRNRLISTALLIIACLGLSLWLVSKDRNASADPESTYADEQAKVESIEGSDFKRVTFSAEAAERVDIQTAAARDEQAEGTPRKVVPYAALLYGTNGETWIYTNPEPLVFVRQSVTVDRIEGDLAILSDGPPSGTSVVVVGATELFGTEFGVGGEED
jgi:hypothetical protein